MKHKYSKNGRVLSIYQRLLDGKVIHKEETAQDFNVDTRSIQRDIEDIRAFLAEQTAEHGGDLQIVFDRKKKGYVLEGYQSPLMTNSEILAISKILLESRALPKKEMSVVLDKLISGCVPLKNMKLVTDLLANEKFHYVELTHPIPIQDKIWDLGTSIQQHYLLEFEYQRQGETASTVHRLVEPVSLLFSEYYFYLNAYIMEDAPNGGYKQKYDYPAIFRLDRIESYRILNERFQLSYADRFQEGEFRKRVQFMYPGRLQKIRFRYTGTSTEAILDRLPTAVLTTQDESGAIVEAEVYGKGIIMWLLSQKDMVEVLSPQALRQEMRETLLKMLDLYQST